MRAAIRLLILAGLASAAACNKQPQQQQQNQDVAITNVPAGADVETLPADESSGTPSNQLVNGNDNPDVNDATVNSD
jgi:hypothetical protein